MTALSNYFTRDLIIHLIIFQGAIILITLWNIVVVRKARQYSIPAELPSVSILVPARNEEKKIQACIDSLLAQNYPEYEITVLDDQSNDRTLEILQGLAAKSSQLTVLQGQPGPERQPGKNWACSQLATAARGDVLFFTDADTIHQPQTLINLICALEGEKADLITGYPRQILGSWGERLLVPFFSWAVLAFFPLGIAYQIRSSILTTSVGQAMLFRTDAYNRIGGHSEVSSSIVDDLALARKVHQQGLRWRVVHLADLITCRMYSSSQESREGFSKNLFAAFEFRLIPYIFAFNWLGVVYILPLIMAVLYYLGIAPQAQPLSLAVCIMLGLLSWIIPYLHLKFPLWLAVVYPFTVLANIISAFRSLWMSVQRELIWKGRTIQPDSWKWF